MNTLCENYIHADYTSYMDMEETEYREFTAMIEPHSIREVSRTFRIVGVTFNSGKHSRQNLIQQLKEGDPLDIKQLPHPKDPNCTVIMNRQGLVLGFISRDENRRISEDLKSTIHLQKCVVHQILGDVNSPYLGLVIKVKYRVLD
jgi:hypothetical protein